MARILGRLWHRLKSAIDTASDRYNRFNIERKNLDTYLDELFHCTSRSIFGAVCLDGNYSYTGDDGYCAYAGDDPGSKRYYYEFLQDQRAVSERLDDVNSSINTLEDILSGEDLDNVRYTHDGTRIERPARKPSRFKNLYISAVAGLGTASRLYGLLQGCKDVGENNFVEKDPGESHHDYTAEQINYVLDIKHKYFWKDRSQLRKIVYVEKKLYVKSIDGLVKDAMYLKVHDARYACIGRINYDADIASKEMKEGLVEAYIHSDKTLKEISCEFEKRYGMHISVSTICRNAKKHLSERGMDFNSRKEAKAYYTSKKK